MTDTETTEMVWEDPPPITRQGGRAGNGPVFRFVEQLKTRPGKWARYKAGSRSQSHSGTAAKHPGTQWATRREDEPADDGKPLYTVYARWVGLDDEHDDDSTPTHASTHPAKKAAVKRPASKKAAAKRAAVKKAAARKGA